MTANQIAYQSLQETKRSNRAKEEETHRSNFAQETETNRANVAKEKEANRHNTVTEGETSRKNTADIALKGYDAGLQTAKLIIPFI